MGKILQLALYVFAFLGVVVSAVGGWTYFSNQELFSEFWAVRDDFKATPTERRQEVIAELPARITFEREVREDMQALPAERQKELYEQLANSRKQVFEQFKNRISAEAEIVRKSQGAKDVAKQIEATLGKVSVGIDLTGKGSAKPDQLTEVNTAKADLSKARLAYGEALETSDTKKRVDAAVGVLNALDKLGDRIQAANKKSLSGDEKERLSDIVTDAKATLYDVKQTPGLANDTRAQKLLKSIPPKLDT
ncbi:MAG: hypothetical protein IT463_07475 [Planctomycetes bacterium]|nr:hypothetical protein [Planctomycetota bacterium]